MIRKLSKDQETPLRTGLILVDLETNEVWMYLCEDYPPGYPLFHAKMAEIMDWSFDRFDAAVRVVVPPGPPCYSFSSFYAGVGQPDITIMGKEGRAPIDRQAQRNFRRAAGLMIEAGLPPDLPVFWELCNGKRFNSGPLEGWA